MSKVGEIERKQSDLSFSVEFCRCILFFIYFVDIE